MLAERKGIAIRHGRSVYLYVYGRQRFGCVSRERLPILFTCISLYLYCRIYQLLNRLVIANERM